MRYLDLSFSTPQENILFDDVLLYLAEQENGDDVLRFWESSQTFIVLGRIGKEKDDLKIDNLLKGHIPVMRRSSGGGTVIQGPGCLNYSLILRKDRFKEIQDLKGSYVYILQQVVDVLQSMEVEAHVLPISDIALKKNDKKISGNAQKRGRNCILHHGTLLYGFELGKIEQYLNQPQDQPEYRRNRPHLDFVTNAPIDPVAFKKRFALYFGCEKPESVTQKETDLLKDFCLQKNIAIDLLAAP